MYKKTKTKKEKNNMKNVKTLLILLSISTFIFASATRTDALGGAGFWADDYANIGAFPASVNNHNVAWTNGDDFTSVWNVDGTTWGFAGGSGDDMANVWWGNGDMGVNLGLGMTPAIDAVTCTDGDIDCTASAAKDAETALNIGFGMPLAGMDFGFTYGMGGDNYGGGEVGVNLRRAQSIWLFENILIGFNMGMEDTDTGDPATMGLGVDLYKNTVYDSGINSLFALGFNYDSVGDEDPTMGIEWNFAVESAMTDWATLRIGYSHVYDFANGGQDVVGVAASCSDGESANEDACTTGDGTWTDAIDAVNGLVVGLGFNYGSFTLDMNVGGYENLFKNPGQYVTGRNETLGANWTISYNW
jgi:hypothetical protein